MELFTLSDSASISSAPPADTITSIRVLMMAAGTGGHVFPALAVASLLKERGAIVHWLGTPTGMENDLVKPQGYDFHAIQMQGLRGKGVGRLLKLPSTLTKAILQAKKVMIDNDIDVVVGFGGYVTAPGGLAAKWLGKPLLIHEQNAIAGMSNRYLAKIADKVMQAFDGTFATTASVTNAKVGLPTHQSSNSNKVMTVGNPVRQDIINAIPPEARFCVDEPKQALNVLVVGGSLGAKVLNDIVPYAIALMKRPCHVHHQTGRNNHQATQTQYEQALHQSVDSLTERLDKNDKKTSDLHQIEVMEFIDDMASQYQWADVIVCRAGALTVSEIQTVGLPAIFVPLPHAVDDHQTANARYLSDVKAAYLLPQSDLTAERLAALLSSLDTQTCLDMAQIGRTQANPTATQTVADLVWQAVG